MFSEIFSTHSHKDQRTEEKIAETLLIAIAENCDLSGHGDGGQELVKITKLYCENQAFKNLINALVKTIIELYPIQNKEGK